MRKYDAEFKQQALKKIFDGQSVASVSRELGVSESLIHKWKQAALVKGRNGRTGDQEKELLALRKRLRELEQENEILKNVWLRRRSQVPNESLWQQAGRMQQMSPASFCEGICLPSSLDGIRTLRTLRSGTRSVKPHFFSQILSRRVRALVAISSSSNNCTPERKWKNHQVKTRCRLQGASRSMNCASGVVSSFHTTRAFLFASATFVW